MSNVPSWKHTTWQTPDKYPGDRHARDWLSQKSATENLANSLSLFIKTIRETIMSNRATSQLLDFSLNRGKSFPKGQEARWFFGFLWHLHCWCSSVLCNPGGYSRKFYTGRLHPEVLPLTLSYAIFDQRADNLHAPSIEKWYPFHIPTLKLCTPFNCCKTGTGLFHCVSHIWINQKTKTFSRLFHRHKMHLLNHLGLFNNRKDRFPC